MVELENKSYKHNFNFFLKRTVIEIRKFTCIHGQNYLTCTEQISHALVHVKNPLYFKQWARTVAVGQQWLVFEHLKTNKEMHRNRVYLALHRTFISI